MAGIRLTLAITWPQGVLSEADYIAAAAQVHGVVGWASEAIDPAIFIDMESMPNVPQPVGRDRT